MGQVWTLKGLWNLTLDGKPPVHNQMRGHFTTLSLDLSVYCACADKYLLDLCGMMGKYECRVSCSQGRTFSACVFLYVDFRSPSSAPVRSCSEQLGGHSRQLLTCYQLRAPQ